MIKLQLDVCKEIRKKIDAVNETESGISQGSWRERDGGEKEIRHRYA